MPLVLWATGPGHHVEQDLRGSSRRKPLIYAADESNWEEMAELASRSGCPLAVHADGDVRHGAVACLGNFSQGVKNLLIDPGCGFGEDLRNLLIT